MRILVVGDVCGSIGCVAASHILPELRRKEKIDVTVINGENSADGNGITPESAESLFACGADVITGGNHSLRRAQVHELLETNDFLLRPDNLPANFGKGYCLLDLGRQQVAVINLCGQIYLENLKAGNPFLACDELINRAKSDGAKIILIDFHAEATSEKRALGFYVDGRVSALFGTHTHVQTADSQILAGGTGYITDVGMTGPMDSVLGVQKEIVIDRLKNGAHSKFVLAEGKCCLNAVLFEIDDFSGKTVGLQPFCIKENGL